MRIREKFLNEITRLKKSESDYPVTKNFLEPFVTDLQSQIGRYAIGDRKIKGLWLTKAQLDQMAEDNRTPAPAGENDKQRNAEISSTLTFTAKDGTVYQDATITKVEPDGLTISHSNGVTKVDFENLPFFFCEKNTNTTLHQPRRTKKRNSKGQRLEINNGAGFVRFFIPQIQKVRRCL